MKDNLPKEIDTDFIADEISNWFPIHSAAKQGQGTTKELKRLIKKGVDIDPRTPRQKTPLMLAAYGGEPNKVKILVEAGADLNAQDLDGNTPLHHAIPSSNKAVEFLVNQGADLELKNNDSETPLAFACSEGKVGAVEALCEGGASTQGDTYSARSLLHAALDGKSSSPTTIGILFKVLIAQNALVNVRELETGDTELHKAAEASRDFNSHNWLPIFRMLIKEGLNPWQLNDAGKAPVDLMSKELHEKLAPAYKRFLKGKETEIAIKIESVIQLKCFYFNQRKYSKQDLMEVLKDGTPAKREFQEALALPPIEME